MKASKDERNDVSEQFESLLMRVKLEFSGGAQKPAIEMVTALSIGSRLPCVPCALAILARYIVLLLAQGRK